MRMLLSGALLLAASPSAALSQADPTATTPPPPAAPAITAGYVLGPNDEIQVTTYGAHPFDVKTRIKEDGTVVLPDLGVLTASGQTPPGFASLVAARLRAGGYYVDPKVSVEVTSFVSRAVTVAGSLGTPGVYPLDRAQSVTMMIARAGGIRGDAADYAILQRAGEADRKIALKTVEDNPYAAEMLRPGDTLFVPKAAEIYVYGQVNKPGKFPIEMGMTLRQAVAQAGGPTLAGSEKKITLHRGKEKIKRARLDLEVKPGDVLYVEERIF